MKIVFLYNKQRFHEINGYFVPQLNTLVLINGKYFTVHAICYDYDEQEVIVRIQDFNQTK